MRIEATAPSKLVLTGEYAVLEGAPAIVAALDRRVRARVLPPSDGSCWTLRSDLVGSPRTLVRDPGGPLRLQDGSLAVDAPATRLPAVVLEALAAHAEVRPLDVELESRALLAADEKTKLGLGSSAALVVALHAAVARYLIRSGHMDASAGGDALDEALAIHRTLQHGRGSGIDVAASHSGGLLRFVRTNATSPSLRSIRLPDDLFFKVIWTGTAATTTTFLARLEAALSAGRAEAKAALSELFDVASQAADAFEGGHTERILELVDLHREGLGGLGRAIGADIVSPRHREMALLAAAHGAVYKPSGAGGGDVGVLLAGTRTSLEAAARAAAFKGFEEVPATLDPQGVNVREEQDQRP